jgi:hypothetical protein
MVNLHHAVVHAAIRMYMHTCGTPAYAPGRLRTHRRPAGLGYSLCSSCDNPAACLPASLLLCGGCRLPGCTRHCPYVFWVWHACWAWRSCWVCCVSWHVLGARRWHLQGLNCLGPSVSIQASTHLAALSINICTTTGSTRPLTCCLCARHTSEASGVHRGVTAVTETCSTSRSAHYTSGDG